MDDIFSVRFVVQKRRIHLKKNCHKLSEFSDEQLNNK